jgi:hypothetical protein
MACHQATNKPRRENISPKQCFANTVFDNWMDIFAMNVDHNK